MGEITTVDPAGRTQTRVDDESATEAIVRAVAEVEGVSPMQVDTPLYDVVDVDLLDRLFAPTRDGPAVAGGRVVFSYRGHEVTVHADGFVAVAPEGVRDLA